MNLKNVIKKIFCCTLSVITILSFAGCSKKEEGNPDKQESLSEIEVSAQPTEQKTENEKIPAGGTYYRGVTTLNVGEYSGATEILKEGDYFPEDPNSRDVYVYGDYEYRYDRTVEANRNLGRQWDSLNHSGTESWCPRVRNNTKETYEGFLSQINKENVEIAYGTYINCNNMKESPELPDTVRDISYAYSRCENLEIAPELPDTITKMKGTFNGCSSLKTYEGSTDEEGDFSNYKIPDTVEYITQCFALCEKIKKAPELPTEINSLYGTFQNCTSLTEAPEIPNGVINLYNAFSGCSSLISAPVIPDGVTNMYATFSECESLKIAPILPENLKDIKKLFSGCTNLVTYEGSTDEDGDFSCYKIPITTEDMDGMFECCEKITKAPVIHENIITMNNAFYGCKSLSGTIEIKSENIEVIWNSTFENTEKEITVKVPKNSTTYDAMAECNKYIEKQNITIESY